MTAPTQILAMMRSRSYLLILVFAAIIGVPVSAVAYFFLALVSKLQTWVFTTLPADLGFDSTPAWWPIGPLVLAGLLVGLTIRYLPGTGGNSPADGFQAGEGPPAGIELPGVILAALATLSLGVVLGPEGPLIAIGSGLAALFIRIVKRNATPQTEKVMATSGSFAAISALLGSPLTGGFLLMEAGGLGGVMMEMVFLPGLLAAGIGSLVFLGLDGLTGLGALSLAIPDLPPVDPPTVGQFGWAIVIGLLAVPLGSAIRWLGLYLRPLVERRLVLLAPLVGLGIAALAIAYAEITGNSARDVLFSGQDALGPFIANTATYPVGALLLLIACKGLAYGLSLSTFRGGPTFPAMFIGAVVGAALAHLPGLPPIAGMAMGIGAMAAVMLRLPLTSVLLASLLLVSDGLILMPLVIVAVVVAYVASAWFAPPAPSSTASAAPAPGTAEASKEPEHS